MDNQTRSEILRLTKQAVEGLCKIANDPAETPAVRRSAANALKRFGLRLRRQARMEKLRQ